MVTTKSAKNWFYSRIWSEHYVYSWFYKSAKTQTEYGNGSHGKYEFWDGADGGINDGDMIGDQNLYPEESLPNGTARYWTNKPAVIPWYGNVVNTPYNDKSRYERVPTDWTYHDNLNTF